MGKRHLLLQSVLPSSCITALAVVSAATPAVFIYSTWGCGSERRCAPWPKKWGYRCPSRPKVQSKGALKKSAKRCARCTSIFCTKHNNTTKLNYGNLGRHSIICANAALTPKSSKNLIWAGLLTNGRHWPAYLKIISAQSSYKLVWSPRAKKAVATIVFGVG